LSNEFKGFSKRNLELIQRWYLFWAQATIAKQVVSQLSNHTISNEEDFLKLSKSPSL
jgi:hypothetical protein